MLAGKRLNEEATPLGKQIASAAQMACVLEVCAPKPGNVNRQHDFLDVRFEDFLLSAIAIGPAMELAGKRAVGETIWRAIHDTQRLVHTNTNLGIVLLLAPLARTISGLKGNAQKILFAKDPLNWLQAHLSATLSDLTVEDARLTYAAIRLSRAGAMGEVAEADVSKEPAISLLQAMDLAKDRDSIAGEYASSYAITFGISYPAMVDAYALTGDMQSAIVQTYLTILARVSDTLIARKRGWEKAAQVSGWAADVLAEGGALTPRGQAALAQLDRRLRSEEGHSLNPGASADLTAAAIFLLLMTGENGYA
jgi:triphosphoribosyl-dephospho-CoA synthase